MICIKNQVLGYAKLDFTKLKFVISLSINFGYAKLDFFNDYYILIDYVSIGILYKLMHRFIWYFIKGDKNSYFIFLLVFGLPLIFTPILYDEK